MINANSDQVFTASYSYVPTELDTIDVATIIRFYLLSNLGGTLMQLGERDEYFSYLTRRWTVNRSKNEIDFILHDHIRFSDGTPITAQDVAYTFKRLIIKGAMHLSLLDLVVGASEVKKIDDPCPGIEVIDQRTVRFRLAALNSLTLFLFTLPDSAIVSRRQVDPETLQIKDWSVSSGAYTVTAWTKSSIELKKNPYFVLAEPGMIERIKIVEHINNSDLLAAMERGEVQYTLLSNLTSAEEYERLDLNGNFTLRPRNYCGTQVLKLSTRKPPLTDKKTRQAIYRYIKEKLGDIRPLKRDDLFEPADHLLFPVTMGKPKPEEIAMIVTGFPKLDKPLTNPNKYRWIEPPWLLDRDSATKILNLFEKIGFDIERAKYTDEAAWVANAPLAPFLISSNMIDEKELHQAIDYMINMGRYFADNREKIIALNRELARADEKKRRRDILHEIALLITDDAVMIPLYYIVHQDILHKDYEILKANQFTSVPKFWNFRKKAVR